MEGVLPASPYPSPSLYFTPLPQFSCSQKAKNASKAGKTCGNACFVGFSEIGSGFGELAPIKNSEESPPLVLNYRTNNALVIGFPEVRDPGLYVGELGTLW